MSIELIICTCNNYKLPNKLGKLWRVRLPPARNIKKIREEMLVQQLKYEDIGRQRHFQVWLLIYSDLTIQSSNSCRFAKIPTAAQLLRLSLL